MAKRTARGQGINSTPNGAVKNAAPDNVLPAKRGRGRPTLYTPERITGIVEVIKKGGSDADACALALITEKTFYAWMNDPEKSDFRNDVTRARLDGKLERIGRIANAGIKGDWRADAWYLERRWPEEYAQQLIVKITSEQAALLKKYGLTAAQAFEAFFQELAHADARN